MATYSVTLTGSWGHATGAMGDSYCYAEIGSVQYKSAQVIEVQSGTVIRICSKSPSTGYVAKIYMDDSIVSQSTDDNLYAEYELSVDSPCTINSKSNGVPSAYTIYDIYIVKEAPSKNHKTLIGGTGYEISCGRTLIDGTGYSVSKGRTLVGGTGYDIAFGVPLGSIAEESIVYVNENGTPAAFYIAKHNYESGLNGDGRTLLVRKDCYNLRNWGKVPTEDRLSWEDSTILPWLNSDYLELLDSKIKSVIGSTKYHYSYVYYNTSTGKDLVRGKTRSDAVFLLSMKELGVTSYNDKTTTLPIASKLKPAYYNGSAVDQWTRNPTKGDYTCAEIVTKALNAISSKKRVSDTAGARPALSLPAETMVNQGTYLITG